MKIDIYSIGKLKKSPALSLVQDYEKRIQNISKSIGFQSFNITEFETKHYSDNNKQKKHEAEILLQNKPDIIIALDETGEEISSIQFAKLLDSYKDSHNICRFIIGGADGLCPTIYPRAHKIISFGKLTWPHMLVRIMLTEQIYRAMTILSNHPYHRS